MSVTIDPNECIGCNLCVPVCPNRAIAELEDDSGAPLWQVKASLCSECKSSDDFYSDHQCIAVCPTADSGCITINVSESTDTLKARGEALGQHRQALGLPFNFAYAENADLEPAPGMFGPDVSDPEWNA